MATIDFFVSYSTPDRDAARAIVEILQSAGFTTFWDQDFPVGTDFVGQIQNGVTKCRRMVAVMTRGYFERPWTSMEWHCFLTKDPSGAFGLLIPVRIEDFVPDGIFASRVYLDFVPLEPHEWREALLRVVAPSKAARPAAKKSSKSRRLKSPAGSKPRGKSPKVLKKSSLRRKKS